MKVYADNMLGKPVVEYNPAEWGRKFANDLKAGVNTTEYNRNKGKKLSSTQKAWRSGYLQARKDEASWYKWIQKAKRYNKSKR